MPSRSKSSSNDPIFDELAAKCAQECAESSSYILSDGSMHYASLDGEVSYEAVAENISTGQSDGEEAMESRMKCDGHG